jgi:hypothetical protein
MKQVEPDRVLYLAVSEEVARGLFEEPIGELLLRNKSYFSCNLVMEVRSPPIS